MTEIRKETDSLGQVDVPAEKLWGAQAQRLLEFLQQREQVQKSGANPGGSGEYEKETLNEKQN